MNKRRTARHRSTFFAAALLLLPSLAAAETRWPVETWNPHPMPEDLVLPLPCGGAMVFRPVATPMPGGALADRATILGQPDAETDYSEYLRQAFVAGPFRSGDGPPVYYLAKYEVTRDQYIAVMAATCPELPTGGGRLPQADLSWSDAMQFTTRLSSWLLRNAHDALPKVDEASAFVRLPTEAEWEYAARGGAAVSETDFGARTFPMPDGTRAYAWFQGSRSANGRARPVGALAPNPLGLFDVLGNVSEWVLEPYRLNKVGRDHGRIGGLVARGGDYQAAEAQLRSSFRLELPPLRGTDGEPMRLPTLGFRPALGVTVNTSDVRPGQFHDAFEAESRSRNNASDDPVRLLATLREQLADPAQQRGIERVQATLRAETRQRLDEAHARLRSDIRAAASQARQIFLANGNGDLFRLAATLPGYTEEAMRRGRSDPPTRDEQAMIDQLRRIATLLGRRADEGPRLARQYVAGYLEQLAQVPRDTTAAEIAEQARVVEQEARSRDQAGLLEVLDVAVRHLQATVAGHPPSTDQAAQDIFTVHPAAQSPPQAQPNPAPTPAPARPRR